VLAIDGDAKVQEAIGEAAVEAAGVRGWLAALRGGLTPTHVASDAAAGADRVRIAAREEQRAQAQARAVVLAWLGAKD
jgi:hypothetical protein